MTTTTVLILRNSDRNYDRLFKAVESATVMGRVASLSEKQTARGYAVELAYLPAEAADYLAGRPKDFEVV